MNENWIFDTICITENTLNDVKYVSVALFVLLQTQK